MHAKGSTNTLKSAALAAGVAAATALAAPAAQAAELYFDLIGAASATWYQSIPPDATPGGQGSTTVKVTGGSDTHGGTFSKVIYSHNGVTIPDSLSYIIVSGGPSIFTGTQANPVFTPTAGVPLSLGGGDYSLTITAVAEPAAWTLMLVGVGGLGAALRLSRRRPVLAAATV